MSVDAYSILLIAFGTLLGALFGTDKTRVQVFVVVFGMINKYSPFCTSRYLLSLGFLLYRYLFFVPLFSHDSLSWRSRSKLSGLRCNQASLHGNCLPSALSAWLFFLWFPDFPFVAARAHGFAILPRLVVVRLFCFGFSLKILDDSGLPCHSVRRHLGRRTAAKLTWRHVFVGMGSCRAS